MIELLGWLAFPIAFVAFRALKDRGYVFAKALGILLPTWGAWMLASFHLLPFGRATIALVIAAIAVVGALVVWQCGREIVKFLREQRKTILIEEILYLGFLFRVSACALWQSRFVASLVRRRKADGFRAPERAHQNDLVPAVRSLVCGRLSQLLLFRTTYQCDAHSFFRHRSSSGL